MLQDMAILTGGQVVSEEVGLKLESIGLDLLGRARKVVVTKDETTIVEGAGTKADVQGRINQIRNEIDNTDSDYDREKLQERLAKLSGGVAIIKVGAATEVELKEKKHRIEDAVQTTKAAVEEGVVPGGGVALVRAQAKVLEHAATLEGDVATGAKIVARALEEPLKQIAVNAGMEGGVIVEKVKNLKGANGLNAATGEYEDLVKAGVIDAAKVTRSALQNAASIAALFLTTEAVVADKPEEKAPAARPAAACPTWAAWATSSHSLSRSSADGAPAGRPVRVVAHNLGDVEPLNPSIGWGVLHLYYRVDRERADREPSATKRIVDAVASLEADGHQALCSPCSATRPTSGSWRSGPDLARLQTFQQELLVAPLVPEYSFVSLTELSEYTSTVDDERARLAREEEGLTRRRARRTRRSVERAHGALPGAALAPAAPRQAPARLLPDVEAARRAPTTGTCFRSRSAKR